MENEKQLELQKHVCWCIDEVSFGLLTKSPTAKQVEQGHKLLKVLGSSKTPLVKKRMLMQQRFGNYRKKIELEEIKWHKETLNLMKKQGFNSNKTPKGTKYRFAAKKRILNGNNCELSSLTINENIFLFNFPIND